MPTVLGELRFGHTTSVYSGKGWVGVSCFWEKYPAVVPCATADEESGSSLKLEVLCGPTLCVIQYKKTCFENLFFFQMSPCIKDCFPQVKPQPYP